MFSKFVTEPSYEKTNNFGFRPGLTQISLYSHRSRLEAWDFVFKKKRDFTISVSKTKVLISFAITANLVCAFSHMQIRWMNTLLKLIIVH